MRFAKGHGTGNDFLILPDPGDAAELTPDLVRRLCDRHTGLGADGVLRAVRAAAPSPAGLSPAGLSPAGLSPAGLSPAGLSPAGLSSAAALPCSAAPAPAAPAAPAPAAPAPAAPAPAAEWFMDYRNADGSIAEMCGNGIRVFARYLLGHGLARGPVLTVATRAGLRQVTEEPGGDITVDMGAPRVLGRSAAVIGGRSYDGLEVSLGNPHVACLVDEPVSALDLSVAPLVDRVRFPEGANVEVVRVCGEGRLEMRVYERGSGATLSCGTGAVAAAVAAQQHAPPAQQHAPPAQRHAPPAQQHAPAGSVWAVRVPGGELSVMLTDGAALLTGPAEIVAEGELDEAWLCEPGCLPAGLQQHAASLLAQRSLFATVDARASVLAKNTHVMAS